MKPNRVLIYRLGSLGDTVVALPSFHLIERAFPDAERRVLTNLPMSPKAPALATVLGDSGLAHSYMSYPMRIRDTGRLLEASRQIRAWKPDVVVYLTCRGGLVDVLRDAAFFVASGVRKIVGLPITRDLRSNRWIVEGGFYEPEAARLARCLSALGDARLKDPESWSLRLSNREALRAEQELLEWPARDCFLACCIGTKIEVKDWGIENWRELLARLTADFPGLGLLMVGSVEERAVSERAAAEWRGPVLNLCGKLMPRETAAILAKSVAFVGHDSGPMHLAAIASIPCTVVFSARDKPRIWFPHGSNHRVIYHHVPCEGCKRETCADRAKMCIASITVDEVHAAAGQMLAKALQVAPIHRIKLASGIGQS